MSINSLSSSSELSFIPHVEITFFDKGVLAMWDSGSSMSFISQNTAAHLGVRIDKRYAIKARAANGSLMIFLGGFVANVRFAGYSLIHLFLVSPNNCCPGNVLLGIDFMFELDKIAKTCLRPSLRKLEVGNNELRLYRSSDSKIRKTNCVIPVLLHENVRLPPGAKQILKIENSKELSDGHALFFEPRPNAGLEVERTIFHPTNGKRDTQICATNRSNRTIVLEKGDIIGNGKVIEFGAPKVDTLDETWNGKNEQAHVAKSINVHFTFNNTVYYVLPTTSTRT